MHAGMQIELFCERRYRGEAEVGRAKQKFFDIILFNDNRRDGVCQRIRILIEYV